ncbi:MAG TPA: NfeD family protein [Candidatus Binatia bacterium]|nr:NfeD family protein [Candidatus Binatia bacterium]
MAWWVWLLVGLGLLGFEMLTPGGFFILFFGLGALVVGALAGLGLTEPVWLQWLLFSLLSVGSLLLFRRRLLAWLQSPEATAVASPIGDVAVLLANLPPGAVGKAELRGTAWSVRHDGPETLARGRRCRVDRVDGLTLVAGMI